MHLEFADPEVFEAIRRESRRQAENLELIASENFTPVPIPPPPGDRLIFFTTLMCW